ncbi:ribokinase [Gracilinema caldarium]|uniref:Ribokinase n=1 Tax=Gracilinema caldarium (strain ATCC 51460 / DSM 7334 / H1) TaxID=744872 RepID=F8F0A9_GRAC1|nr:ribokinase [Gracilinema caldarium]AEJ18973.1 Ribokinase [Gracilinema caldarium DSM 7334]
MRMLNFGSLNIDYVYRVDTFLKPGETKAAKSRAVFAGGKGLNQSLAMAKAGLPVYHAGKVGAEGDYLVDTLQKGGVNTSLIGRSDEPSGHTIIQVDDQGRNCILLFGGANQDIDETYIDEVLASFGQGDYLVLQNEISLVPLIIEKAKAQGLFIILNPSPYTKEILTYPLEFIDMFLLNEIEAEGFTGQTDPRKALDALCTRFPHAHMVLTLGEKGALWGRGTEVLFQKAYPVKAVDTTAAGDTFSGYFIAGLVEGLAVSQSLDLAARAASLCVSRPGAADSIPWRRELG